jgi:hypothetical protein
MKSYSVKWGSYKGLEGPWSPGTERFKMPERPNINDQIMATITATEGGSWNAVNMYDSCICTVGLIQWCERSQFSVSAMLGGIVQSGGDIKALSEVMIQGGLEFRQDPKGRWRFHMGGAPVNAEKQQRMFLLNSTGKKGTWDDDSRRYAKLWVASLVELFGELTAVKVQRDFTAARLKSWFAIKLGREWLNKAFENRSAGALAFICGYLSFAANNPTWANNALAEALKTVGDRKPFETDWLAHVFEFLTWQPGVSIYPHRYNKIRPVLEGQFGIDLPDLASDLKDFSATPELLLSTDSIQALLVKLGYDLGVSGPEENGVDDVWGSRTTQAFKDFEAQTGLPADGRPDARANAALLSAAEAIG